MQSAEKIEAWEVENAYDLIRALEKAERAVELDKDGKDQFVSYVEVGKTDGGDVTEVILWKRKLSDGSFVFDLELKVEA